MNSLNLELLKLDKKWYKETKENSDVPLYVCFGYKPDLKLLESYFEYQNTEESRTKDLFLIFFHEFENSNEYGKKILKECFEFYKVWLEENEGLPDWNQDQITQNKIEHETDAYIASGSFSNIYKMYPQFQGKNFFILLSPSNFKRDQSADFERWIREFCKTNNNHNIKLVIKEYSGQEILKDLPKNHPITIQMDHAKLMKNVSEQTNREKGSIETNYQQQMLSANEYLSKGKTEEAFICIEKAIKISKLQKLLESECAARLLMGEVLTALGKKKEAEYQFEKLLSISGKESLLGAQMHMNYASYLLTQSKRSQAITTFEKVAEISKKIDNPTLEIESWRIIGELRDLSDKSKSVSIYEKCLEIAEGMPSEMRRYSSIPYIGGLLMKRYGEKTERGIALENKMQKLIGENWKSSSSIPIK